VSNVNTYLLFNDGQATPFLQKITGNTATTITQADASTGQVNLVEFSVIENNGGTPNLSVYITDGTNIYYLPDTSKVIWNAKAVTARQSVEFSTRILPLGYKLTILSSDASGHFDVIGTKVGKAR